MSAQLQMPTILVVTALPEERDAILELLPGNVETRLDKTLLAHVVELDNDRERMKVAVLLIGGMGNVKAATVVGNALRELCPDYVMVVGIAGGVPGKTELKDVIVSTDILYYEKSKITSEGAEDRLEMIPADPSLIREALAFCINEWSETSKGNEDIRVEFGVFASGDKVVASSDFRDALTTKHPKLVGFDMESYGVASAVQESTPKPRFIAVRCISDHADEDKGDGIRFEACRNAALFSIGLVKRLSQSSFDEKSESAKEFMAIHHISLERIPSRLIQQVIEKTTPGARVVKLEIDQTSLDMEVPEQLEKALEQQLSIPSQYDIFMQEKKDGIVGYFGLAHIPLAFELGAKLTNKRPVRFYEFDRYGIADGTWIPITGDGKEVNLFVEGLPKNEILEKGDVVIRVSISASISTELIRETIPSPVASIHLGVAEPKRDSITSQSQMRAIGKAFRDCLDNISFRVPNRQGIHLYYAGPCSLAFFLGQLLLASTDPRIFVYNFSRADGRSYPWGIRITQ